MIQHEETSMNEISTGVEIIKASYFLCNDQGVLKIMSNAMLLMTQIKCTQFEIDFY